MPPVGLLTLSFEFDSIASLYTASMHESLQFFMAFKGTGRDEETKNNNNFHRYGHKGYPPYVGIPFIYLFLYSP